MFSNAPLSVRLCKIGCIAVTIYVTRLGGKFLLRVRMLVKMPNQNCLEWHICNAYS